MGLFSKKPKYVQVVYHDLGERAPESVDMADRGYTFLWQLSAAPTVGTWVWIDGLEGSTTGIITSLTQGPNAFDLKPVLALVDPAQHDQFAKVREYNAWKKNDDLHAWIEMGRQKAGFPAARVVPDRAPGRYEPIPAAKGRVTGSAAKDRGRIWWRLYNLALEHKLPENEIAKFKEISEGWYARSRM